MTTKADRMGLRHAPMAFTEQGVAMLSSVLNSERAIRVNIGIMRRRGRCGFSGFGTSRPRPPPLRAGGTQALRDKCEKWCNYTSRGGLGLAGWEGWKRGTGEQSREPRAVSRVTRTERRGRR